MASLILSKIISLFTIMSTLGLGIHPPNIQWYTMYGFFPVGWGVYEDEVWSWLLTSNQYHSTSSFSWRGMYTLRQLYLFLPLLLQHYSDPFLQLNILICSSKPPAWHRVYHKILWLMWYYVSFWIMITTIIGGKGGRREVCVCVCVCEKEWQRERVSAWQLWMNPTETHGISWILSFTWPLNVILW